MSKSLKDHISRSHILTSAQITTAHAAKAIMFTHHIHKNVLIKKESTEIR